MNKIPAGTQVWFIAEDWNVRCGIVEACYSELGENPVYAIRGEAGLFSAYWDKFAANAARTDSINRKLGIPRDVLRAYLRELLEENG